MNWSELNDEINTECFDAFKEDVLVDWQTVPVIWLGEQESPNTYEDMPVLELKIEIKESDKSIFTKGALVQYHNKTYSVFREAIQNPSNQAWEVELEP